MMLTLLQYFFLGFVLTAIPGAVFFETIRRTLTDKSSVIKFLIGNFVGMLLLIISVLLGLSALLSKSSVSHVFYTLSSLVLIYIGVTSFFGKQHQEGVKPGRKKHDGLTALFTGFILATANPISIVFWISTTGKMLQGDVSVAAIVLDCLSIVLGALSVFVLLITVVSHSKRKIPAHHFVVLAKGFGLVILAYGLLAVGKAL